jgi:uncharacterized protein YlxW (UPF0749 family)
MRKKTLDSVCHALLVSFFSTLHQKLSRPEITYKDNLKLLTSKKSSQRLKQAQRLKQVEQSDILLSHFCDVFNSHVTAFVGLHEITLGRPAFYDRRTL